MLFSKKYDFYKVTEIILRTETFKKSSFLFKYLPFIFCMDISSMLQQQLYNLYSIVSCCQMQWSWLKYESEKEIKLK